MTVRERPRQISVCIRFIARAFVCRRDHSRARFLPNARRTTARTQRARTQFSPSLLSGKSCLSAEPVDVLVYIGRETASVLVSSSVSMIPIASTYSYFGYADLKYRYTDEKSLFDSSGSSLTTSA